MQTKDITDLQVCEAYAKWKAASDADTVPIRFADSFLMEMTGAPEKVCYRAMERADDHGLINYGVSLRSGWLSDKGKALLEATIKT